METTKTVDLVKGIFTPEEAKLILSGLINHKINFHYMKNFSSRERLGVPVDGSQKRISDLTKSRGEIFEIIEKAVEQKCQIKIDSTISISID
ncbi:MAG: hypothetical protein ABI266_02400 [Ginsengibacter sp.]